MHRPESVLSENSELIQDEKAKQGLLKKAHSRLMFTAYPEDSNLLEPEKSTSNFDDSGMLVMLGLSTTTVVHYD